MPLREISHVIPSQLRGRITLIPNSSSTEHNTKRSADKFETHIRENANKKVAELSYTPAVVEFKSNVYARRQLAARSSMRIPGAIVIDPYVRKLSEPAGIKASENAVWLIVVAMKEYTKSLLESTISTIKAVEAGLVPHRLAGNHLILPRKRTAAEQDDTSAPEPIKPPGYPTKCITSLDLHGVTANLPTSARSLSGCVSRTTFERSLAYDSSVFEGGTAFDELKKYIVSSLTQPDAKRLRVESPELQAPDTAANKKSVEEDLKSQKSSPSRGLGRGAEDLAALKARASTPAKSSNDDAAVTSGTKGVPAPSSTSGESGKMPSSSTQAESAEWIVGVKQSLQNLASYKPTGDSSWAANFAAGEPSSERIPATGEQFTEQSSTAAKSSSRQSRVLGKQSSEQSPAPLKPPEQHQSNSRNSPLSSQSVESATQAVFMRKGKGHGVKNLAAMRARTQTFSNFEGVTTGATADQSKESALATTAVTADETDVPSTQAEINSSQQSMIIAPMLSTSEGQSSNEMEMEPSQQTISTPTMFLLSEGKSLTETDTEPSQQSKIKISTPSSLPLSDGYSSTEVETKSSLQNKVSTPTEFQPFEKHSTDQSSQVAPDKDAD